MERLSKSKQRTVMITYSAVGLGKVIRNPVKLIEHLGKDDDSSVQLAEV